MVGSRKHTRKKEGVGGENGEAGPRCLGERRVAGLGLEKERGGLALSSNNNGNDGDNHNKGKMPPALVPGKCPQRAG